jgi:hypothetical protein
VHDSVQDRVRRLVLAAGLAVGVVLVTAAPAGAHTVGGEHATNYQTRIGVLSPAVRGIALEPIEHGNRLQLRNTTARDVVVLGYDGEPYLRVGPRGVFENTRSPATYLNRTRFGTDTPPKSADPSASPAWRRLSGGTTARWHDHRAHWMSTTEPPAVQRAPDDRHLIQRFTIRLQSGGDVLRARGDVSWIPPPSPWPWIALALGFGVAIVVLARTRWSVPCTGGALGIVLVATAVHAAGAWGASYSNPPQRLADTLPTLGAFALGVIAEVQLFRRGMRAAAPLLVFAGLFVGIAIGLADLSGLSHSELPTDLPYWLDRLTIALALGGGFGVALGAAFHIGAPTARRAEPPRAAKVRAAYDQRSAIGR